MRCGATRFVDRHGFESELLALALDALGMANDDGAIAFGPPYLGLPCLEAPHLEVLHLKVPYLEVPHLKMSYLLRRLTLRP